MDEPGKQDGSTPARARSLWKRFDESRFWRAVGRHTATWGRGLLQQILTLYYCMIDPKTPPRSKAVIAGVLAYTVLPTDLIPDFIPVVGWSDDAAAIAWAGYEIVNSIRDEHRERARAKTEALLGGEASG